MFLLTIYIKNCKCSSGLLQISFSLVVSNGITTSKLSQNLFTPTIAFSEFHSALVKCTNEITKLNEKFSTDTFYALDYPSQLELLQNFASISE